VKHRWRTTAGLALVAGIGLALAGCARSPLAVPNGGAAGTYASPPIITVSSDGTLGYVPAPVGMAAEGALRGGRLTSRSLSVSATVEGARGGTIRAGRFSVQIPAGAFSGSATVMVSMADSTVMMCDLTISPKSANVFKYPAVLTADLSGTLVDTSTFPSTVTVYWYDPVRRVWVNLAAQCWVSGSSVSASLDHFSKYSAGKAGW